jgi:hypothetical protein
MMHVASLVIVALLSACSSARPAGKPVQPEPEAPVTAPVDRCSLPPEQGPCEAMMPRVYYDAQALACRRFVYGGCDGNANNFGSAGECIAACARTDAVRAAGKDWRVGAHVIGCKVGEDVYAAGATRVPLPGDCNTCTCTDGKLEPCTKVKCPGAGCPAGTRVGTTCAQGGTADGCVIVETACLTMCETDADCANMQCIDGLCRAAFP